MCKLPTELVKASRIFGIWNDVKITGFLRTIWELWDLCENMVLFENRGSTLVPGFDHPQIGGFKSFKKCWTLNFYLFCKGELSNTIYWVENSWWAFGNSKEAIKVMYYIYIVCRYVLAEFMLKFCGFKQQNMGKITEFLMTGIWNWNQCFTANNWWVVNPFVENSTSWK